MIKRNSLPHYGKLVALCAVFLVGLLCGNVSRAHAQGGTDYQSERQLAFQLFEGGKFAEAQAKFEKLAAANSSDGAVMFGLGMTQLATSKNIKDPEARRQARRNERVTVHRQGAVRAAVDNESLGCEGL